MFRTRARSCARADDAKIVRSRNAQCKTRESPKPGQQIIYFQILILVNLWLLVDYLCSTK